MPITNPETATRIDEIEAGIFRISTPVPPSVMPGGFTFNQFLVVDDEPLLFHTGPRRMFPLVRQAIAHVMDLSLLRWISFSHVEADECGSLDLLLEAAPRAQPLCGQVGAMVSIEDLSPRAPRVLQDGETLALGRRRVRWYDTPHLPHNWEAGYLFEASTATLFCGDLFTQGGHEVPVLTESDILGPSEAARAGMDYFAHGPAQRAHLERLAAAGPRTLACMHGSAWRGDGAALLRAYADALEGR